MLRLESNLLAETGDIFLILIGTFWYLVYKKIHDYFEIINLCSVWRWKTVDICKNTLKIDDLWLLVLFCEYLRNERSFLYHLWNCNLSSCDNNKLPQNFFVKISAHTQGKNTHTHILFQLRAFMPHLCTSLHQKFCRSSFLSYVLELNIL